MGKGDQIPEGFEGNLTKEQTEKLKEVWRYYFQVIHGDGSGNVGGIKAEKGAADGEDPSEKRGEKGEDAFKDKSKDDKAKEEETKQREMKEAQDLLGSYSQKELRDAFWTGSRGETPDALMLRFLRARKWDINRAFAMAASVGRWRLEMDVAGITKKGEEGLCEEPGFRHQYDSGKTYIQGTDKQDRPLVFIHVRKHRIGDQSQEALQRFTIFGIESAKSLLTPRCRGQGCIIFDLEGFGLMNMDWLCLRYLIEIFEARYPETLGVLLIHKAPMIALGIWKIVMPFLDPNVREKIVFTNSADDLEKYIPRNHIPVAMGGDMQWQWAYTGPTPGENDRMKDKKKRSQVIADWDDAIEEFEDLTKKWIDGDEKAGEKRQDYGNKLIMTRFYDSDPWVRGQTVYSRNGTAVGDGRVKWKYPDHEEEFGESYDDIRKDIGVEGVCPKNGHKDGPVAAAQEALDAADDPDEAAAFAAGAAGGGMVGKLKRRASQSMSAVTPGDSNADKARANAEKEQARLKKDLEKAKETEKKQKEEEEAKQKEAVQKQNDKEAAQKKKDNSPVAWASWAAGGAFSAAAATAAAASTFVPAAVGGDKLREYTGANASENDKSEKPKGKEGASGSEDGSDFSDDGEDDGRPRKDDYPYRKTHKPRRTRPAKKRPIQTFPVRRGNTGAMEDTPDRVQGKPSIADGAVPSHEIDTSPEQSIPRVPDFDKSNVNYDQKAEPAMHIFSDT